ncbi:MAG TPA: DNA polymerase Y family protein [Candidatus Baltobacteraceae bacterium]|jgi:protein ImuB|nr:DNA polymerase Y family protein [Candidatus Baltobacteraceae bacterium]
MLLCVHLPAFGLAVARRENSAISPDEPAVLADKPDRGRVIELDPNARRLGARAGQTVLQARAAAGGVHVLVHDAAHSRAVWSDMLDALDAVSPLVDDSGEGTAYLEMRGVDGGEQTWIARAKRALHGFNLPVRVACGPNKFVARARTYAPDGCIERLPVEVLQIDPRAVERLHLLGVRTLDDLAKLPHGPFVRRFGKAAAQWHDWARGIDPAPLRPRAHEVQIDAAVYGEGTAAQEEQIFFALRILADRVCSDLQRAGRAATLVRTTFECENGDVREIETGFAQATAEPRTMLDVMRAKLEGTTFDSPVTGLRLQAMRLEEWGTPATLFGQHQADPQALAVALARLHAATGAVAQRARVRPAAQLEGRFFYSPFEVAACHPEVSRSARTRGADKGPAPQLRLLAVREIDVTMRGNAPATVGARAVLDCAGPWRVDDGWFESPVMRDEFDVLLDDGMLCRIYRQGEHWYLRGAYD